MNCAECQEQLVPYIEQLLDDAQAEPVVEHLRDCPSCQAELEGLQTLQGRLVSNGKAAVQRDLEDQVMNRIIREQKVRLNAATQATASLRLRRLIMKSPITRIAVAAAVVAVIGISIHGIGGGTPAFADVVRPILEAQTATFKMVTNIAGQPAKTVEGQFMAPGLERYVTKMSEAPEEESIAIVDYVTGRGVALFPSRKTAMVTEATNRSGERELGTVSHFKRLRDRIMTVQENPDEAVEYLGKSKIAGRTVIGYRMSENGIHTSVWADVDSLLPLQIEYALTETVGLPGTVTMMDIEFNVDLDPAAFSTEIPEGYTAITVQTDASTPTENDVIDMLRISAEATDGRFPAQLTLDAMTEVGDAHLESKGLRLDGKMGPAMQEWMQIFLKINRSRTFLQNLPEDADWHYAGTDATFGDNTTPVFWYRPEGSETYRVIYADLSVLDVTAETLATFEGDSDR